MCRVCGCESKGLNPRQKWSEMATNCTTPSKYGCKLVSCNINNCPRLNVKVPADEFYTTFCRIYGETKGEACRKMKQLKEKGLDFEIICLSWVPRYKDFVFQMEMNVKYPNAWPAYT